ncbi:MAG: hypothetical protein FWD17_03125 [Polyangiaceae bacterium]|nr:hypothetical protein [Polyangiaceae bacterium]
MSAESPIRSRAAAAFGAAFPLFVVAYPISAYVALGHVSARAFALGVAAAVALGLVVRLNGARRAHALVAARVPMLLIVILLVGSFFDDRRFVLAMPAVTNALFLTQFVLSLRTMPIAERFARAQEGDITPRQVAYCRNLTVAWSLFFVVNGAICGVLAVCGPLAWWTLYTGLLSYVALGAMATIEYVVRKARFRTYGEGRVDRTLARLFPPRRAEPLEVSK